jgi:hypothetical protein
MLIYILYRYYIDVEALGHDHTEQVRVPYHNLHTLKQNKKNLCMNRPCTCKCRRRCHFMVSTAVS